ncbi:hypothetical protein [Nonomuraea endophytica]|uniref:Uncharacterized protein n=1 Tax=Nonomuraea endophytica TaxID=714136 RepID=A0A7W8EL72_9ACTN|nr:hypothetical protein [Nonomuraea endophytica]MBB5083351.1 hypothetical protein [Nonomuraea endophytica]
MRGNQAVPPAEARPLIDACVRTGAVEWFAVALVLAAVTVYGFADLGDSELRKAREHRDPWVRASPHWVEAHTWRRRRLDTGEICDIGSASASARTLVPVATSQTTTSARAIFVAGKGEALRIEPRARVEVHPGSTLGAEVTIVRSPAPCVPHLTLP